MSDLDSTKILQSVWHNILTGTQSRHHAFHLASFHYLEQKKNWPRSVTVVMRSINEAQRQLSFHTDRRQNKALSIQKNPTVSLLFYDQKAKEQVSIQGSAHLENPSEKTLNAWKKMQNISKLCYLQDLSPGSPSPSMTHGYSKAQWEKRHDLAALEKGYANFGILTTTIHTIEWLYIRSDGNIRIQYTYQPNNNTWKAIWLVP